MITQKRLKVGKLWHEEAHRRLSPASCSRVISVESIERLADDLQAWAEARFKERTLARREGRELPHHRDNHYCACGQEDAAQRIRDLIREESFFENAELIHGGVEQSNQP
jgi:hypothetical protein